MLLEIGFGVPNPEQVQALESLRLARTDIERQLAATANERRKSQLTQAMAELDRRIAAADADPTVGRPWEEVKRNTLPGSSRASDRKSVV